jgi:two-component system CheB/CheR fusion protein
MYFEGGTHKHVLALLHFALAENGHLFLGTAETIGQEEDLFEVVSRKWRIYRRMGPTRHDRVRFSSTPTQPPGLSAGPMSRPDPGRLGTLALQALVERFVPASVLVNRRHEILYFAGPTHHYLHQPTGVPTQHLMSRARVGLETRLRSVIRKAERDGEHTVLGGARVRRGNAWHRVRLTAEPLRGPRELDGLLLVSFVDEPGRVARAGRAA